jgi:DNA-binding protein YbaB
MFNKLKQFKNLRDQAKELQGLLAQEKVDVEKHGIKLSMNGNMEVTGFTIPDAMPLADIQRYVPDLVNDAVKKAQRIMAQKIQSSGFKMPEM